MQRKSVITVTLAIVVLVVGFIFLLKGCLAKYDERFIKTPALVFEKDGRAILFAIVEFQKTTSYSRKGNFVRKSVNTHYYIQTNDGETGALVHSKKIKNHRNIKQYPVEIVGASGATAWLFMGELMAFDASTLNKTADIKILEEKNPALLGKLPAERQFYSFNNTDNNIYFTAKDGTKWQINTQTLAITSSGYQKNQSPTAQKIAALEQEEKLAQDNMDTLYRQKSMGAVKDYADKKISAAEYRQLTNNYYIERGRLNNVLDSLRELKRKWEKDHRKTEETERTIESLRGTNLSFSQTKQNQDTAAGQWFGIYSDEELEKLYDRVSSQIAYDETARRKLVAGNYTITKNEDAVINKASAKNISTTDFLAAGFLVNKKTGRPVRLPGNQSYLIVHKEQVGREGKILITNVTPNGKVTWTYNTQLTDWTDWIYTGRTLYVFGVNNKNLSSNESNILICITLDNGRAAAFDYFTNKIVNK